MPAAHSSSYVVELGEYSKDCLDCLTAALQVFPYTNELRLWDLLSDVWALGHKPPAISKENLAFMKSLPEILGAYHPAQLWLKKGRHGGRREMSYIQQSLGDGEVVVTYARFHKLYFAAAWL